VTIGSRHRTRVDHASVAAAARQEPGVWRLAAHYATLPSAESAARRVPSATLLPSYAPAGAFEAYCAQTSEGPTVWVRCTEGGPYPQLPRRMVVRVPAAGERRGEVKAETVTIRATCRVCGAPRGWNTVEAFRLPVGDTELVVDRWSNPCGHEDVYGDVLEEARRIRWPADRSPASRGRGHHAPNPARAGEFQEAVLVLLQVSMSGHRMAGRPVVALLQLNGHDEAAWLVGEQLTAHNGNFSARQAAHFLTVEGARRASARTSTEAHA
jgi:hypothetical protein